MRERKEGRLAVNPTEELHPLAVPEKAPGEAGRTGTLSRRFCLRRPRGAAAALTPRMPTRLKTMP